MVSISRHLRLVCIFHNDQTGNRPTSRHHGGPTDYPLKPLKLRANNVFVGGNGVYYYYLLILLAYYGLGHEPLKMSMKKNASGFGAYVEFVVQYARIYIDWIP